MRGQPVYLCNPHRVTEVVANVAAPTSVIELEKALRNVSTYMQVTLTNVIRALGLTSVITKYFWYFSTFFFIL